MRFYDTLADHYDEIFPFDTGLIEFVKQNSSRSQALLDLGCATGELCLALAEQGWETRGIDLDEKMIGLVREKAADSNITADFQTADIIEYLKNSSPKTYDNIVSFGNTLVHILSEDDLINTFDLINKSLKPDGSFLGQILNYNRILDNNITDLPDINTDKLIFKRNYDYQDNSDIILFRGTLIDKESGKESQAATELRPIRVERSFNLLKESSFKDIKFFASPDGEPFSEENSIALYFCCTKS
jgi:SAM-dependent methyltransferase